MVDDVPSAAPPPPEPDFGILLMLAARAYADDLHRRLAEIGFQDMRASFGFIFRQLRASQPTPGELALRLGVSKQAIGKVLDDLEARGLVERRYDDRDRRARRIVLTERGRAVSDAALRFSTEIEADLQARVGVGQVDALRAALRAYVEAHGDHTQTALTEHTARPTW